MFPTLQSPIHIGSMRVKNRFVVPPMGTNYGGSHGEVTQQLIDYYVARAKGGYGLIIVEVTAVDPLGKAIPFEVGLWSDEHIPGWKRLTDAVHAYGAKIIVQLHHAGRQTAAAIIGSQPVAPSALPCPLMQEIPRALSTKETWDMVGKFRDAAVRAHAAGFDGVEIHGAHGYLIAQYMSAHSNRRTDEFGGSFMGRMKFPLEIVRSVRRALGNDFPLVFRLSADEKMPGGRTIEESKVVARLMEANGINALHVSICTYGSLHWMFVPTSVPAGFNAWSAEEIKKSVNIPVITVGRINDPYLAEDIVASGKADMVSLGRASLAEPAFPNKAFAGETEEIAPCIACLQGCEGYLFNPAIQKISCMVNPFTGKEALLKRPAAPRQKVLIAGAGPAGLYAAWLAASRGHDVTLYEKEEEVGGQFRIAGMPPTKQPLINAISYFLTKGRKYGVKLVTGTEVTPQLVAEQQPDFVILATGGVPLRPAIKGLGPQPDAVDVLAGRVKLTGRVLVVGGGMVGAELADYLCEYGCQVTIMEMEEAIAKTMEDGPRRYLLDRLNKSNAQLLTNAKVLEFLDDGVIYENEGDTKTLQGFTHVVLALGAKAWNPLEEPLRGKVKEVHVIGDAVKARNAIIAIEEAAFLVTEKL